jgi:molecular chaperone GrpE
MTKKENSEEPKIFKKSDDNIVINDEPTNDANKLNEQNNDNKASQQGSSEQTPIAEQPENETDALRKHVRTLEEENSSLKDQILRKQAEFENYRKRLAKDKDESLKYANQMLLLDLTGIIDDFERAMRSAEDSKDFTNFHNGVVLIEKQLVSALERQWGLKRFEPAGEVFDPERHLAIAVEESNDKEFATITEVYQKGYMYFDRVLRPAKVKVVKPIVNNTQSVPQEDGKDCK